MTTRELRLRERIDRLSDERDLAVEVAAAATLTLLSYARLGQYVGRRRKVPPHGTEYRYGSFGCRCPACTAATSLARAARRARANGNASGGRSASS